MFCIFILECDLISDKEKPSDVFIDFAVLNKRRPFSLNNTHVIIPHCLSGLGKELITI